MRSAVVLALLAAGCADPSADREAYARGLRAPVFTDAWAECTRIADLDLRGDCGSAVIERYGAWESCGDLPEGRWRDECFFLASEVLGRQGDTEGALRACQRSAYAEQCNDHVLGMWAMAHLADSTAEIARGLDALRPLVVEPRAANQVWRSWFRNRLARGLVVDPTDCPDKDCRSAAQMEVAAATRERQRYAGDPSWCTTPPPPPDWATTEIVQRWIAEQITRGCQGGLGGPAGIPAPPPLSPGGNAVSQPPPPAP